MQRYETRGVYDRVSQSSMSIKNTTQDEIRMQRLWNYQATTKSDRALPCDESLALECVIMNKISGISIEMGVPSTSENSHLISSSWRSPPIVDTTNGENILTKNTSIAYHDPGRILSTIRKTHTSTYADGFRCAKNDRWICGPSISSRFGFHFRCRWFSREYFRNGSKKQNVTNN